MAEAGHSVGSPAAVTSWEHETTWRSAVAPAVRGGHLRNKGRNVPTAFDVRTISGLTEAEATRRLEADGYNELPVSGQRGVLAISLEVVREPMFLLLVACGLLYL